MAAGLDRKDNVAPEKRLMLMKPFIDPVKAQIGRDSVSMVGDLLEALGIWPFTTDLGWTAAQFDQLMEEVRAELQNAELKLYIDM